MSAVGTGVARGSIELDFDSLPCTSQCSLFELHALIIDVAGSRIRLKSSGVKAVRAAASGGEGAPGREAVLLEYPAMSWILIDFPSPFRDFSGNFQIQNASTAQLPLCPQLQRVNVYDLQFAHCAACVLRGEPCLIGGSRGAAAVAIARAALGLEVGQVHVC